jgi:putative nucleotidyltransferase with HDIG domain
MTTAAPPFDAATAATMLVDEIVAALVNTRIYRCEHPRVQGSIDAVRTTLRAFAVEANETTVAIGCADGMVVHRGRPLLGASIGASRLITLLQQWGAGGIELGCDVTVEELGELFAAIVARPQPGSDYTALNQLLQDHHCRAVRLLPPFVEGDRARTAAREAEVRVSLRFYQSVVDTLQNVTVAVCKGGHIDFAPVQSQAEEVLKQLEATTQPLLGLARQDQYDAFTFGHSLRVAILALHFARTLTDDRELVIRIGTAALLHDVGKSLVPFEILHSTRPLDEEERRQMNRHAELGAECLLGHKDADPLAVSAAFGHHRLPGGGGYPSTKHAHEVSMVTRVVKICDVFEALTAARPYKKPMSPIRAYRVMLAMGDKLDQRLLRKFIESNGIYPNGQLVELDDGTVAVVHAQGSDPLRPTLGVVRDNVDHVLVDSDTQLIDLADIACHGARSILAELTPDDARQKLVARAAENVPPAG